MSNFRKLYVAGPMTGLPDLNGPTFRAAARQLRAAGYEVVSPEELDAADKIGGDWDIAPDWHAAMRRDIKALVDCQGVATLPGWRESRGAKIEVNLAMNLDLPVHHVLHWLARAQPLELQPVAAVSALPIMPRSDLALLGVAVNAKQPALHAICGPCAYDLGARVFDGRITSFQVGRCDRCQRGMVDVTAPRDLGVGEDGRPYGPPAFGA